MKRLLFILLLVVFCLKAKSQIFTNATDFYSGVHVKGAVVTLGDKISIYNDSGFLLRFGVDSSGKNIALIWSQPNGNFGIFNNLNKAETRMIFKMDDSSSFKFKADTSQLSPFQRINGINTFVFFFNDY